MSLFDENDDKFDIAEWLALPAVAVLAIIQIPIIVFCHIFFKRQPEGLLNGITDLVGTFWAHFLLALVCIPLVLVGVYGVAIGTALYAFGGLGFAGLIVLGIFIL